MSATLDREPADEPLAPGVRAARMRLGLTQRQVAERMGLSLDTFQNWDRDSNRPGDPAVLQLLALVLETPLEVLYPPDQNPRVARLMREHSPSASPSFPDGEAEPLAAGSDIADATLTPAEPTEEEDEPPATVVADAVALTSAGTQGDETAAVALRDLSRAGGAASGSGPRRPLGRARRQGKLPFALVAAAVVIAAAGAAYVVPDKPADRAPGSISAFADGSQPMGGAARRVTFAPALVPAFGIGGDGTAEQGRHPSTAAAHERSEPKRRARGDRRPKPTEAKRTSAPVATPPTTSTHAPGLSTTTTTQPAPATTQPTVRPSPKPSGGGTSSRSTRKATSSNGCGEAC